MIKTTIVGIGDSTSSELYNSSEIFFINKLEKFLPKYYPSIYWNIYSNKNNTLNSTSVNNILNKKILPLNPNIVIVMIGSFDICKKNKDIGVTSLNDGIIPTLVLPPIRAVFCEAVSHQVPNASFYTK